MTSMADLIGTLPDQLRWAADVFVPAIAPARNPMPVDVIEDLKKRLAEEE